MHRWRDLTLGDLVDGLVRYRPFIVAVVGVLLVTALLPGKPAPKTVASAPNAVSGNTTGTTGAAGTTDTTLAGATDLTGTAGSVGAALSGGANGTLGSTNVVIGGRQLPANEMGPDCDPATGRVRVPTKFAPACMPPLKGSNGGATYKGVTANSINVVVYRPQVNPATQAALTAAGAADTDANTNQTYIDYLNMFPHYWNTYGRKINVTIYPASGADTDDAAATADAIDIAENKHAFAVINAPGGTTAFSSTLAAHGVECICTTTLPQSYYLQHAPYVWSTLMDEGQAYLQRAEYIGKRLKGRLAQWAGDAALASKPRKFGLLWYETADHAYGDGHKFFLQELAKYGISLGPDDFSFTGANIDPSATQTQATTQIARMSQDGVTSIIFVGDPLSPAIYTTQAERQRYHPEWVITGSALTDWTLFARTYEPNQWKHAFGVSFLTARDDPSYSDAYRLYAWHYGAGKSPPAGNTYPVLYAPIWILFSGIHMAGPNLNPTTFRDGLFNFPLSGAGGITTETVSFGRHNLWPWDDYMAFDDTTEIWWDPTKSGKDEVGHTATGMYEYVDGGKRYLLGQWPTTIPKAFARNAGEVDWFNAPPPQDQPPNYPNKQWH